MVVAAKDEGGSMKDEGDRRGEGVLVSEL
jgi:hypothetical protein